MFAAAFAVLALPFIATASPYAIRASNSTAPCSTGTIQCCNSEDLISPYSNAGAALLSYANLDEHPKAYIGHIATSCTTGIGILNGGACASNPVCCDTNGGLISIGCVAITL